MEKDFEAFVEKRCSDILIHNDGVLNRSKTKLSFLEQAKEYQSLLEKSCYKKGCDDAVIFVSGM